MAESGTKKPWFCHMLRCRDGSFYVGITNDLEERTAEHNRGKDSAYTAKRLPVRLVWSEQHPSREAARRQEIEIKGWRRKKNSSSSQKALWFGDGNERGFGLAVDRRLVQSSDGVGAKDRQKWRVIEEFMEIVSQRVRQETRGLRVNPSLSLARGLGVKGRRFNGRPPVSKTGCGGSNPSAPVHSLGPIDPEQARAAR